MQKFSSLLGRLAVVAASALALGACNRAEYAMLPASASYLGTKSVASAPRPAARPTAAPVAPAAEEVATATPAPAAETLTPATPAHAVAATPAAQVAPATKATPVARREMPQAAPAAMANTSTPAKLNLAQRLALHKITKKLDKLAAKTPQFKQHDATAETARINGNLRTGIILLLIGLIVSIFSGLIGGIIALIGLIFVVLWLLDEL